jgi:hypothetical protein
MAKKREHYSDEDIRNIHADLIDAKTKAEREDIYKDVDAAPQAIAAWFRGMGLPKIGAFADTSKEPKKRGRPSKFDLLARQGLSDGPSTGQKKMERSPAEPRPPTTKPLSSTAAASGRLKPRLSVEEKEVLIRLLSQLLEE